MATNFVADGRWVADQRKDNSLGKKLAKGLENLLAAAHACQPMMHKCDLHGRYHMVSSICDSSKTQCFATGRWDFEFAPNNRVNPNSSSGTSRRIHFVHKSDFASLVSVG